MGGVGKTQVTLEYVYTNQNNYERIYWITAVDQASLLLGYQKIAEIAELKLSPDSDPVNIAETVIRYLRQIQSYLLVIDNLDDIEIVHDFLPEPGPQKHTIITTRNPNTEGIPAEGIEVPLLGHDEALDLLSTLSKVEIISNSAEKKHAEEIITKLERLPLAIEQAGAYVREAAGDFATFLEHYEKRRKELHRWVPKGNWSRQYPFSVATTWSLSFNTLRKTHRQTARLFQLFSFLNPDGILIDFLISAVKVLGYRLRNVVSDSIKLAKALNELEQFSLIKWNCQLKSVQIHRLVQQVIRDEMSEKERTTIFCTVVDICDKSFPEEWNINTRLLCRSYFGQVSIPLLSVKSLLSFKSAQIMKTAKIMGRVGEFLKLDGNYKDSAIFFSETVTIAQVRLGEDHLDTLTSLNNLAWIYLRQGELMK